MCGIAGIIHKGQLQNAEKLSAHFISGLRHRGPDFQQSLQGPDFLLMHTRLSVIDLSERANQPFESADARYVIVLNGEIYNFRELRKELEKAGRLFKTHSDTEVLLTGFMEWGEDIVNRLDGMFAFAIWDKTSKQLFMARDRAGKKPLFFCQTNNLFCFASESDVIATSGLVPNELSMESVNSFLAIGYILAPGSLYRNIFQLKPGNCLWLNTHNFTTTQKQYWSILSHYQNKAKATLDEATENIKILLQQAVSKRLIADVEIGVFLSGGIDSSIIAALAAGQQQKLKTFTASFNNQAFDESTFAALVSKYIGAKNYSHKIDTVSAENLQRIIAETDGVLSDTSLLAMNPLAKFTRQYVKVVLSGDGADELFGGYATYKAQYIKNQIKYLPAVAWKTLHKAGSLLPAQTSGKVSMAYKWDKFFGAGNMDNLEAHYHYRMHHSVEERIAIMGSQYGELIRETDPLLQFREYYNHAEGLSDFEKLLYVDFKTWLCDDILVKTDRSSMQWGLEVRSPFLDKQLLEFTASLPAGYKNSNSFNKTMLRNAFKSLLPPVILNRKKSGFNVPMVMDKRNYTNEYKFFNYQVYKHKING